jgi:hypothetical protein
MPQPFAAMTVANHGRNGKATLPGGKLDIMKIKGNQVFRELAKCLQRGDLGIQPG